MGNEPTMAEDVYYSKRDYQAKQLKATATGLSDAVTQEKSVIDAAQSTQNMLLEQLDGLVALLSNRLVPVSADSDEPEAGIDNGPFQGRSRVYSNLYESNASLRQLQYRVSVIINQLEV